MNYKNITPARKYLNKKLKDQKLKILVDEERTKSQIARLIRMARERAGLSQREIAKRAKTTQAVVARLELGTDSRMPSLMLISRLLKAAHAHLEIKCVYESVA